MMRIEIARCADLSAGLLVRIMPPSRRYTSMTLGQYPKSIVRLVCSRCDRKGQYKKETLIALYGADVTMPDLLHLIAKCERHGKTGDTCGVRYGDLLPRDG